MDHTLLAYTKGRTLLCPWDSQKVYRNQPSIQLLSQGGALHFLWLTANHKMSVHIIQGPAVSAGQERLSILGHYDVQTPWWDAWMWFCPDDKLAIEPWFGQTLSPGLHAGLFNMRKGDASIWHLWHYKAWVLLKLLGTSQNAPIHIGLSLDPTINVTYMTDVLQILLWLSHSCEWGIQKCMHLLQKPSHVRGWNSFSVAEICHVWTYPRRL